MKRRVGFKIGDKTFDILMYIIALLFTLICIYPLYLVVISSVSSPYAVASGKVWLAPVGFSLDAYKEIFANGDIVRGYMNSIFYTVAGTLLNLALTLPAAYALSKTNLYGRNVLMMLIVFTMYFSGGMIPHFLLIRGLGLLNTRSVVLLGTAVSATNLIVSRTFFASAVPRELEEAAEIDGCSIPRTFLSIVLPLSKAMIGVITLYYAVARWNNFTASLYYQPIKREYHSLQMVLRNLLLLTQNVSDLEGEEAAYYARLFEQIKYSVIIVASVPFMILYPFLQKYFDKGVMMGSVKG